MLQCNAETHGDTQRRGRMARTPKRRGKWRERSKGAGTLERRSSGVYIARWMVNGQRYTQSTGTKDRAEAERKLAEFTAVFRLKDEAARLDALRGRAEGVRGRLRELEKSRPALKLADAWEAYMDAPERSRRIGEKRLAYCESRLARLVAFMAHRFPKVREMRELNREHAAAFLADIDDRSNATINAYVDLFRRVWAVLAESDEARLDGNPWEKIKRRRVEAFSRLALTPLELELVCGYVTGELRLLFAVGIYTGLRLGDCALLKWQEVDTARRVICVVPRKTRHTSGAGVIIPMHPALLLMLQETERDASGYVMPELAELYERNPFAVTLRIGRVFKACGIETTIPAEKGRAHTVVGFHSLRHTFVSLAANAGAPLALIQSIVGHSSTAMTRHYFHESEAALAGAVALLPDVLNGDAEKAEATVADGNAAQVPADGAKSPAEARGAIGAANCQGETATRPNAVLAAFDALAKMSLAELRRVKAEAERLIKAATEAAETIEIPNG